MATRPPATYVVCPRAWRAHLRVYPITAKVREDNDAWISGIDAPEDIHSGEPVTVRVISGIDTTAQVSLREAKAMMGGEKRDLKPSLNRMVFEVRLERWH